jgi:hypothetical protein
VKRRRLIAAAALTLASCGKPGGSQGQSDAAVAVLPGSASDAMIPYDTLRSQPPKAATEPDQGGAIPGMRHAARPDTEAPDDAEAPAAAPEPSAPAQ